MSLPHCVSEIIENHVSLELEGIDRMYLNVYVPQLQREIGAVNFFKYHRGHKIPSSILMGQLTREFVGSVERFCEAQSIEVVVFQKGQRKDAVMKERLEKFKKKEGVVFMGKAQEKAYVHRTEKRRTPEGKTYPWIVKSSAVINHFYFYCFDEDFGPFFLKFCSYFPYNAKLCINGHEYLKRQLKREKIAFEALDNGILSCANPNRARQICDQLDSKKIDALLRKWLKILPHPFTAKDRAAGFRYDISILQAEFSLTQVLKRPVLGRLFFEEVIRENLDIGRPSQIQLIFDRKVRKTTPGRFRTRVITSGVIPSLHVDYKNTRIKQYHKENQALRTETTINDTYDFAIGKRLKNLPALREIGFKANRRLLDVQRISHDCSLGEATFAEVNRPKIVGHQRISALRFADPKVQAILHAVLLFGLLPNGFTNQQVCEHMAQLLGMDPSKMTRGMMTYNLRRLKHHGLIEKIPKSHRYRITEHGARIAMVYVKGYDRLLRSSLSQLGEKVPPGTPYPIRLAFEKLDKMLDKFWEGKLAS
jgi:hypothetical protein